MNTQHEFRLALTGVFVLVRVTTPLEKMNIEEYHKMRALESTYWWFQARRKIILSLFSEVISSYQAANRLRIVDIGCGTGMMMEDLAQFGEVTGLDFSPIALTYCRQRGLQKLIRADVEQIPLCSDCADILTAFDLVEHVENDRALLQEMFRILKPSGYAFITVPAHKKLWSMHDVALHHKRRYEKKEFESLVRDAGFAIERYSYIMMSIYPMAALFRKAKRAFVRESTAPPHTDEFPLPQSVNAALLTLVSAERHLLRRWNLPFGLSLFAIVRKPPR
ncbi:MAG: class I SAM-dependent methyltransferase [Candidatus Sumerlaeaceae bacterium]|nr:class I SAM-dependent methyltransferase [Candidatus Sumerlaeaceae bacterium]